MKKIGLFFLFFFLSLLMLDIFLRIAEISMVSTTDFDKNLGRVKRKNLNYTFFNEGFSMGQYNDFGYLGPSYSPLKDSNIIRVALIGDSFVEGYQVFDRNHFRSLIENNLNSVFDSVEVLNFGRSGFDLADMYAYYQTYVKQYSCDYICFFISNGDLYISQNDPLIPKVIVDNDSSLLIDNNQMPESYKTAFINQLFLSHNSVIINILNNSRKLLKEGELWPKLFDKFYSRVKVKKNNKATRNISNISFKILQFLRQEKPQIIFVNRDKEKIDKSIVEELKAPICYIDLYSNSGLFSEGPNPFYWEITGKEGHWNIEAHKLVAYEVSNFIEKIYTEKNN